MTPSNTPSPADNDKLSKLLEKLDKSITQLRETAEFAKPSKVPHVLDIARRVLMLDGGCAAVEERIEQLESGGIFAGSDWAQPHTLIPSLSRSSLQSADAALVAIESLSQLRMLAVAKGQYRHALISDESAHHFLTQVVALNLSLLFSPPSEAERESQGRLAQLPRLLFQHIVERIGYEHIIDELIQEIWRILQQRPIQVEPVKQMITQIALCQADPNIDLGSSGQGAGRLVSSLYGPTQACREDPGIEVYRERLVSMDNAALQYEATGFARAMHDTGLVSAYHGILLRHLLDYSDQLLAEALGLSATGRDCLLCYHELVHAIIRTAIHPETPQAVYGLALTLERGILYQPPIAQACGVS